MDGEGEWKAYIRVMRNRIEKKNRDLKRILKEIQDEVRLINTFMELEDWP